MRQKLLSSFRLRVIMLVAILCSVFAGTVWGQTETILTLDCETPAPTGTTSNSLSTSTIADFLNKAAGLSSATNKITCSEKTGDVYEGKGNGGTGIPQQCLKIGKASGAGSITFTIPNTYDEINEVEMTCYGWKTSSSISVNNGTAQTFTTALTETTKSFELATPSRTIKINVTSSAVCITKIVLKKKSGSSAPTFTITAQSNNNSYGTVTVDNSTITATPASGYRVSTTSPYTITDGEATISQNGNVFTVTATSDCNVQINFEAIPTYTVTIETPTGGTLVVKNGENNVSNNDKLAVGTVLTITATPSEGYNFRNWQAVDVSTHTFTSGTTYTMTEHDVTIKANFDAKVYHTVTWSINGNNSRTQQFEEGGTIVFPNDIADVEGKTFVGWVSEAITGVTDEEPTFVTSATMGDNDVTYYAVFAEKEETGSASSVTYEKLTSNSFKANATYVIGALNGSNVLAFFYNYANIDTNSSWGKMTTDTETNTPLTFTLSGTANALYAKDNRGNYLQGDENDFKMVSESNKKTIVLDENGQIYNSNSTERLRYNSSGNYGLRWYATSTTTGNLAYFYEMIVTPAYSYSAYCTTVAPDTRTAVNMTDFTAGSNTLVKGNTATTTVTNDQNGWTAAYTYASDNTDVATVNANGVITAVAKGTANITATLNVDKNDANYKAGDTKSMSVEITVKNPSHTVAFYNNGTKVSETKVEEDTDIDFPSISAFGNFELVGWATEEISGNAASAPSSTVTSTTMGNDDITYYAVYRETKAVTATFVASDISNLKENNSKKWTEKETGIVLSLSAGQHYTSGTPNTFTVTKGTSNYFEITAGGKLNSVVTTISEASYRINSVSTGTLSTDDITQTITFSNNATYVKCYATSGNQIRATEIVVNATLFGNYYTTLAEEATVTAAGWGTYVTKHDVAFEAGNAYVVTEADTKTTIVEVTEVPAGTPVLLKGEGIKTATFVASTPSAPATNLLHVSDGTIDANAGAYVLGNKNDQVGFYKWTGTALAAGKVYLQPASTAREFIGFDDDSTTTGINSIDNGQQTYDNVYDLQGRRVAQPAKGMYIVNGKKVIK